MKQILLLLFLIALPYFLQAQIIIARKNGSTVKLSPSGEWEEASEDMPAQKEIDSFTYPSKAKTLVEGKLETYGVQYDAQKWEILRGSHSPGSLFQNYEYEFSHRKSFAVGLLMADTVAYPIDKIISISLKQIKESATEFTVAYGEVFNVNDKQVYMVILQTVEHGIPLTYYNYYYSGSGGSIQFLGYCNQEVFWKFEDDIKDLLNGLIAYK